MTPSEEAVVERLATLGVEYARYEHPPVATAADAEVQWAGIDATHVKNLFLRNQRGDRHYLVIALASTRVDLRRVADQIGDGKLSFASPERLLEHLGVAPGAVSPFGLLHDPSRRVKVFVDRDLQHAARLLLHPNVNTVTLVVSFADFERFVADCGHAVRFIDVVAV